MNDKIYIEKKELKFQNRFVPSFGLYNCVDLKY